MELVPHKQVMSVIICPPGTEIFLRILILPWRLFKTLLVL